MLTQPNLPTPQIVESVEALWGIHLQPAGCPTCKQVFLVDPGRINQACPACARSQLVPQPALLRTEPPELQVAFRKGQNDLLPIFEAFTKGVWIRPDDFNPAMLLKRTVPIYWPMWLVDSDVAGPWQAEVGFDYQVKSSQENYNDGGWRTREVIETRIRWEPRLGVVRRHYDNVAAPALSEHNGLWNLVGGYRLDQRSPYDPARVGGAAMRVPDLQPESSWPLAKSNLDVTVGVDCQKASGAQHIRNLSLKASYEPLNWTQMLLPLYISFYTDDSGQPHPVYVNGQTGAIGGLRLASQRKGWRWAGLTAAAAGGLLLIALLCFALSVAVPPLALLGIPLAVLAIAVGLGAIVPAVWPWQWNRKQQPHKITTS